MCKEDVFEHHRFCDEFSHLVNRYFMAISTLYGILSLIEQIIERIQRPFISFPFIMQLSMMVNFGLTSV